MGEWEIRDKELGKRSVPVGSVRQVTERGSCLKLNVRLWSGVLVEKLIAIQQVNKFPALYKPKGSLSCTQGQTIWPCPKPGNPVLILRHYSQ
jgi:hypothetical protein